MIDWYNKWLWQKSMAWVNIDKKIAFKNIGKCASSSFKKMLEKVGYKRSQLYINGLKGESGWKTFTIVREPFDRFTSGVISVLSNEYERLGKEFKSRDIGSLLYEFVDYIELHGFFNDHILPMKYTISDSQGKLYNIDLFILYERLHEDMGKIINFIGEPIELMYSNTIECYKNFPIDTRFSSREIKNQFDLIIQRDKSLKKHIYKLYIEDFQLYEYVRANYGRKKDKGQCFSF